MIARLACAVCAAWYAACSSHPSAPAPTEYPPPAEATVAEAKPICRTTPDVQAHLGEVCIVTGTYEVKPFLNKKGEPWRDWPVLVLEDHGRDVLLESIWDEQKMPTAETIARYRGHRVEVVGKLHASPPQPASPPRAANMAALTISPVASIRVID
jgi:hypothetical protein